MLSVNGDKWIQAINSTEIYACETSKDIIRKNEEIKHKNIINRFRTNTWNKQRPSM